MLRSIFFSYVGLEYYFGDAAKTQKLRDDFWDVHHRSETGWIIFWFKLLSYALMPWSALCVLLYMSSAITLLPLLAAIIVPQFVLMGAYIFVKPPKQDVRDTCRQLSDRYGLKPVRCLACDYDIRNIETSVCPECGAKISGTKATASAQLK
ncbi:MAG: hypothetical protein AAF842_02650 [Planctomycetota bacterium]